jgi:hypothetical protein
VVFVLLPIVVAGFVIYDRIKNDRQDQQTRQYALVTAQVWVATARLRNEPETYLAYRDSVLRANGLSRQLMEEYLALDEDHPEEYYLFTSLVNEYVDSITTLEMGLKQADSIVKELK